MNDEKVGLKLNIHYKAYFCLKQPLSNHLQSTSVKTVLYSPPAFEGSNPSPVFLVPLEPGLNKADSSRSNLLHPSPCWSLSRIF